MRLLTGLLAQFGKVFGKVVITYPALAVLVGDLIAGDRDADQGGGHRKLCVIVAQSSLVLG